ADFLHLDEALFALTASERSVWARRRICCRCAPAQPQEGDSGSLSSRPPFAMASGGTRIHFPFFARTFRCTCINSAFSWATAPTSVSCAISNFLTSSMIALFIFGDSSRTSSLRFLHAGTCLSNNVVITNDNPSGGHPAKAYRPRALTSGGN